MPNSPGEIRHTFFAADSYERQFTTGDLGGATTVNKKNPNASGLVTVNEACSSDVAGLSMNGFSPRNADGGPAQDAGLAISQPLFLRIGRAAVAMGVSRPTVYALLAAGRLKSLRIGRARLITVKSILALADKGGVSDLDAAIARKTGAKRPRRDRQSTRKAV
jgi:excisionase family DNA binding protein